MGAGKSTTGAALATRLGLPFVDLDQRIVQTEGLAIPELFAQGRFRAVEARVLREVLDQGPCVLACGGGASCQPGAMERLRAWGEVVYLEVPLEELRRRVGEGEGRPLWDEGVEARYAERQPSYARAHHRVDGRGEDVVERILEALGG